MLPLSSRRLPLLSTLALPIAALAAGVPAGASSTPPSTPDGAAGALPEGYERLVDDTGFLTVVAPESWTVVDTAPSANDDGSPRPWIFASSVDLAEFNETFTSGVLYAALPFQTDPEAFIADSGLNQGCETIEVEPYSDPIFTGFVQVGTNCGPDGGTWNMVAANPADESFTAIVQLQISSPDEQEAFDTVLGSFTYAGDPTVPPGMLVTASSVPASSIPASSIPASSVPDSSSSATIADPAQLVSDAAAGYRTFIAGFEDVVFEDEDSIKVGECPVVDVAAFSALMSGLGLTGPYEAESGGEMELFDDPVEGELLRPVGVFCDLDVSDDEVTTVDSASVIVIDGATHPDAVQRLQPIIDAGGTPTTGIAGLTGDGYTVCGAPFFDDTECAVVWFGDELVVALSIEYAGAADPATTTTAFESVLPAVLQQLAGRA